MGILNEIDTTTLNDIRREMSALAEDINLIGIDSDENGELREYLQNSPEGRNLGKILDNLQEMLEQSNSAIATAMRESEKNSETQKEFA